MENLHKTVLLKEAIESLNLKPGGVYIDATFGFGGHTKEMLSSSKNVKVIGIEWDKEVFDHVKKEFKGNKNVVLHNCCFTDLIGVVKDSKVNAVDGILWDLGTNLYQLKKSGRGFSFQTDERLDMRLNQGGGLTAEKILNSYSKEKLEDILKKVDERFARVIAEKIIEVRRSRQIITTKDLVDLVYTVKRRKGKIHPATLTFMALRMEVNKELENIEESLKKSLKILNPNARLVVIAFHSGEDRIVKNFFKEQIQKGVLKIINKKVIRPSWEERKGNPMSRSAKMRIAEVVG